MAHSPLQSPQPPGVRKEGRTKGAPLPAWRALPALPAVLPAVLVAVLLPFLAPPPPIARAAGGTGGASPPAAPVAAAGATAKPAAGTAPAPAPGKPTGAGPAAAAPGAVADRRRENKLLVRRYLTEVLAAGRLEKLDEIVGKTFVDRSPGVPDLRGPAAVRQAQRKLRSLFSKLEYDPQELIAEDDRVAARYLVLATPRAEPGGPAPQPLVLNGVALFQIRDGRIQEAFVLNDQLGLLRQLGYTVVPPRAGGPSAVSPAPPAPAAPSAAPPAAGSPPPA